MAEFAERETESLRACWGVAGRASRTLKRSSTARVWMPGCFQTAVSSVDFAVTAFSLPAGAGVRDEASSSLTPFATLSSTSTTVLSALSVVQDCVKVTPDALSWYLASMSALMSSGFLVCRSPKTRKVTLDGVRVLTSSDVRSMGKSLLSRSFDDLPTSYTPVSDWPSPCSLLSPDTRLPDRGNRLRRGHGACSVERDEKSRQRLPPLLLSAFFRHGARADPQYVPHMKSDGTQIILYSSIRHQGMDGLRAE